MMTLPGYKELTKEKEIITFLEPNNIYISLKDGDKLKEIKIDDYINKHEIIGERKNGLSFHSSVSGTIEKITDNYICIKNDQKEKSSIEEKSNMPVTKQKFVKLLKEKGISGMGGTGFPTYIKYNTDGIKYLVVNAVECEPYITADYKLTIIKAKEIIKILYDLIEIIKLKKVVIGVKKTNLEMIKELEKHIKNDKIEIKIVDNAYPMGYERLLIKKALNISYQRLPKEKGIVVNNINTIYSIYEMLYLNKPVTERIVTITGDIENTTNVLVKVGTKVKDILEKLKIKVEDKCIIMGGPMMGDVISDDEIITSYTNSILIKEVNNNASEECLRCGKCDFICPVNLSPVLIKDNHNDKEEILKLKVDRCCECGLCSYICPSKIKVREYVRKAKELLKEENK
jgi:electron transport complex, RnfABCDGE type, C subunit